MQLSKGTIRSFHDSTQDEHRVTEETFTVTLYLPADLKERAIAYRLAENQFREWTEWMMRQAVKIERGL